MELNIIVDGQDVAAQIIGHLGDEPAEQFAQKMQPLLDNAGKTITVYCSRLEAFSSAGLRFFMSLHKEAFEKGGRVIFRNLSENLRQELDETGFSSMFEFATDPVEKD